MPDRKRAPRREPDLEAVLEAAVDSLLRNGERGFRIEHIIERTGISRSSLYLHFTDRDGLVEAASMEIFAREVSANIDRTVEAMRTVASIAQAREIIPPLIDAIAAQAEETRWNRIIVLVASRHRPSLLARMIAAQTEMNDRLAAELQRWKDAGILRAGADPHEVASFIQANTLGRVIRDLDDHRDDMDSWKRLMVLTHMAIIADE